MEKLNFFTLCGAIILFFLPWTTVQCSGHPVATQSGVQSIYAGASLSGELRGAANPRENPDEKANADLGYAVLVGLALVAAIGGAIVAALALFKGMTAAAKPGMFAAAALVLILIQLAVGFPINNTLTKARSEAAKTPQDMNFGAVVPISADRTFWFYAELILLAIPAGIFINSKIPNRPKSTSFKWCTEHSNGL